MSINILKSKIIGISFIFNLDKKVLLILILLLKFNKNVINIGIINLDTYYTASILKIAQTFTISKKNLKF